LIFLLFKLESGIPHARARGIVINKPGMKRRSFIWLSLAGTAGLAIPLQACHYLDAKKVKILTRPYALSSICDIKTIREIGLSYLKAVPQEADKKRLGELLMQDGSETGTLEERLILRIEGDFKASDIMVLDGWVVARTEARQCALYSYES
jgi:hypothetical protein